MIIGSREAIFGMEQIPKVELKPNTSGIMIMDYLPIVDLLLPALKRKMCRGELYTSPFVKNMAFSMEQTLVYLHDNGYLKEVTKDIPDDIKLWKERINLGKRFEAIRNAIISELYKYCYPRMSEAMQKGAIMSHWGLTCVHESVEYIMEFLKKEDLLMERHVQ